MGEAQPNRGLGNHAWRVAAVIACVAIAVGAGLWLRAWFGRTTFPMRQVRMPDDVMWMIPDSGCLKDPFGAVTRYPSFTSAKPLFGRLLAGGSSANNGPDAAYYFAIDESKGTGSGYDTLYLDANRNMDLADEKPAKGRLGPIMAGYWKTYFDLITIAGGSVGGDDMVIAARLMVSAVGEARICFAPGYVRQGRVRMGKRWYTVTLVRTERKSNRYDLRTTLVRIFAPEGGIRIGNLILWRWGKREEVTGALSYMYPAGNGWYSLSASSTGDALTVHPYTGKLGEIKVSWGGGTGGNFIANGVLHSDSGVDVVMPQKDLLDPASSLKTLMLPVGDYAPQYISVRAGSFYLGVRRPRPGIRHEQYSQSEYFLKVREDAPTVVTIPSTAGILWWGDGEDKVFKPGDTVSPRPMLTTPTVTIASVHRMPVFSELRPKIRIVDSTGRMLTEGTGKYAFSWEIPANFTPRDGRETLKMTATWDTGGLFGEVTGTKEIVVESTEVEEGK